MDVCITAPAKHPGLLLRQKRKNLFRPLRLRLGTDDGHSGPVHSLSGGFSSGAKPGADQQFKHRVAHMGQANAADAAKLIRGHVNIKVIFHRLSSK